MVEVVGNRRRRQKAGVRMEQLVGLSLLLVARIRLELEDLLTDKQSSWS